MSSKLDELGNELNEVLKDGKISDPLILVFYLGMEEMGEEVVNITVNNVKKLTRDYNIITFFLPCKLGEEKVECLNPVMYKKGELDKLNTLIKKIDNNFFNPKVVSLDDESVQ